jgi:hypothetical protein
MDWEERVLEARGFWKSSSGDEWQLRFKLVEINGRMECVGLDMRSADADPGAAPRPLLAKTVRELPYASMLTTARRETAALYLRLGEFGVRQAEDPSGRKPWTTPERARETRAGLQATAQIIRPPDGQKSVRHARHTRAELERVAEVYTEAHRSGGGTKSAPTKAVAETLGLTYDQAAKLVQRCRKIGLLGGTEKGIAGGVLPAADAPKEGSH